MRGSSLKTVVAVGLALFAGMVITGGTSAAVASPSPADAVAAEVTPTKAPSILPSAGYLESMWAMVGEISPTAVQPVVPVVRLITADEAATVTAACLRDEGFADATATADGGLEPGVGASVQPEKYFFALYVCAARYPIVDSLVFG